MIALAADHGGFALKEEVKNWLIAQEIPYRDFGSFDGTSCDYPLTAAPACRAIAQGECKAGLLFCGTGLGMSMVANKFEGVRAACCSDCYSAKYTRIHNNANVLCLGGRVLGTGLALELVEVFLNSEFEGGERHTRRLREITDLEQGALLPEDED